MPRRHLELEIGLCPRFGLGPAFSWAKAEPGAQPAPSENFDGEA